MSDPVESAFRALQLEYLASMPARLEELRSDIAGLRTGVAGAEASLKVRLHRLAGSGGSYGFVDLSALAREAERCLAAQSSARNAAELETMIERLAKAVETEGQKKRMSP